MHYSHLIQSGTAGNDLADALFGYFFREACLMIQEILQTASISVLKDAVVVGPRSDDLFESNDILAADHLQKDELTA